MTIGKVRKEIAKAFVIPYKHILEYFTGMQESGLLMVATIPKKMIKTKKDEDNLDYSVSALGNPWAVGDAIVRKCNEDQMFREFIGELIEAVQLGLDQNKGDVNTIINPN